MSITLRLRDPALRLRLPPLICRRCRLGLICEGRTGHLESSKVSDQMQGWDPLRSTCVTLTVDTVASPERRRKLEKELEVLFIILVTLRNTRFHQTEKLLPDSWSPTSLLVMEPRLGRHCLRLRSAAACKTEVRAWLLLRPCAG